MVKDKKEKKKIIDETKQKKELNVLWISLSLIFLLFLSFVLTFSVFTPEEKEEEQYNIAIEHAKDTRKIVDRLQSVTPEQQKSMIESYGFKSEEEKNILSSLEDLEELQKDLKEIQEDLKGLDSTDPSYEALNILNEITTFNIDSHSVLLDARLLSLLTGLTLKYQKENIINYSKLLNYSGFIVLFISIMITLVAIGALTFINISSFFEKEEDQKLKAISDIPTGNLSIKNWRDALEYAHKRLWEEGKRLQLRNSANLLTGFISATLGAFWLLTTVLISGLQPQGDDVLDFVSTYWPRLGLILIVEAFAIFFLRLYAQTMRMIERNKSDLTNIELRLTAGLMLYDDKNKKNFSDLAKIIAQEDSKFILGKNESSGGVGTNKITELLSKLTPKIGG